MTADLQATDGTGGGIVPPRFVSALDFFRAVMAILFFVCILFPMKLEWDETKRETTMRERGLDFASVAAAQWDDALTVEDARGDYGETRFVSLVPIDGRLCVVAWCRRGEALRVISLRKANARERKAYDGT